MSAYCTASFCTILVMKMSCRFAVALMTASIVMGCSAVQHAQHRGVDAEDTELLAILSSVAREGTHVLCDPVALSRKLDLNIGPLRVERSYTEDFGVTETQLTDEIKPARRQSDVVGGYYTRGTNKLSSGCHLQVKYRIKRLCQVAPEYAEPILKVAASPGPVQPHGQDFGYEYTIETMSRGTTKIRVGQHYEKCVDSFSMTVNGEWK